MSAFTRRQFIKLAAASSLGALSYAPFALAQKKQGKAQVVVVGAGFGGATCAKYIRRYAPDVQVTLVEPNKRFITCPFSNTVIGGLNPMSAITHGYDRLRKTAGIALIHDTVTAIDAEARTVRLHGGKTLRYDRLVVAPGIDIRFDAIPGYDPAAAKRMPHAWKAGAQTVLLRKQLKAMKNGGTVVITSPPNPFRCPPGPYERASLIAHYLKKNKPKSKVLILDAKDKFSKQGLFMEGWQKRYPGMIEWVPGGKGGAVQRVEPKTRTIVTELETYRADVANIIPPQRAARIAQKVGLTNEQGWCPIDPKTMASTQLPGIHVIGDAAVMGAMPKSAYAANSEAKVCAAAVIAALKDLPMVSAKMINTCYSLIAPDYGISVAGVYHLTDKGIVDVDGAGGVSPADADATFRAQEADYTRAWYKSIVQDTLG